MSIAITERVEISAKSLKLLSKSDLVLERHLHDSKWFDYRFMSPLEATIQFRKEFQKVYRAKYSMYIDTAESENKFGVRPGDPCAHKKEFTSFWRARQQADVLGIPYNHYLWPAFEKLLRNGYRKIPYVNQFLGKNQTKIAFAAWEYWKEIRTTRLKVSELPLYRNEAYEGLQAQDAHRAWVISEIRNGKYWTSHIRDACFLMRMIPEDLAVAEFGTEIVDEAREAAVGLTAVAVEPASSLAMLPSCAALPAAFDPGTSECGRCKLAGDCARMVGNVTGVVVATTGSDDPVVARRRALQRRRTQRHRAKKKGSAGAASLAAGI